MNHSQESLARALETYAAALGQLTPSPQLQARMQAAIASELAQRPPRARIRRWSWAIAASIVLGVTLTYTVRMQRMRTELAEQANAVATARAAATQNDTVDEVMNAMTVFPTGAVSLWPTQGTVFRVRSTLSNMGNEQQYWIDVRMANDGSMRVERVFAADGTELFARPQ
jgi:hypothetical protein